MDDYKELIEMLRSRSKSIIHEDAELVGIPEENIWDADANALVDAADAIEQLVKERDAAVADLKESAVESAVCDYCKWLVGYDCTDLEHETCQGEHWEWRGVQEDNTAQTARKTENARMCVIR